jgi:hypothetical protein
MEAADFFETLVRMYQTTWHHTPEDGSFNNNFQQLNQQMHFIS